MLQHLVRSHSHPLSADRPAAPTDTPPLLYCTLVCFMSAVSPPCPCYPHPTLLTICPPALAISLLPSHALHNTHACRVRNRAHHLAIRMPLCLLALTRSPLSYSACLTPPFLPSTAVLTSHVQAVTSMCPQHAMRQTTPLTVLCT